jgi:pyroglutamyl-peptidase
MLSQTSRKRAVDDWILVTGFGPFPGVEVNPTQILAERLTQEQFQGLSVVSRVLDVSFERAAKQLLETLCNGWPRFIVHFGVATGSDRIQVESQGVNCKSSDIPDVDDQQFESDAVNASYPLNSILRTSILTENLTRSLNEHGYPALYSEDAGRYVCNATYFNSLAYVAESKSTTMSVFIHVPAVCSDPDPKNQTMTTWTHERLYNSAAHIIDWLASER